MSDKRASEPAYPARVWDSYNAEWNHVPGMTKREAFAMAAMQGILGNPLILDRHGLDAAGVADSALSFADALLSALNGEPRNG